MKGKSSLASFICPTPLQDVPLDLTPTSGTPSTAGLPAITPILTPNTWASIEQVFKDLTGTPQVETPNGDDSSSTARSVSSSAAVVPTVVEALHNEGNHYQAENLSLKKQFAVPSFDRVHTLPVPVPQPQAQIMLSVAPKKPKLEKPAIVAATTTTTDPSAMGHISHSQALKRKVMTIEDSGLEVNKVTIRRERNRMAAARCRQRRVDLTQSLLEECNALKAEKAEIQEQLQRVQQQKEHLEFILQAHESLCKVKLMTPEVATASLLLASDIKRDDVFQPQAAASLSANGVAAKRPSSLHFAPKVETLPLKKKLM